MSDKAVITTKDVAHIAKLANLPISEDELVMYADQLAETVTYIASLQEVATEGVAPTSQVTGLETVLAKDEPRPSLLTDDVFRNTKSVHKGFFTVAAVLDQQ